MEERAKLKPPEPMHPPRPLDPLDGVMGEPGLTSYGTTGANDLPSSERRWPHFEEDERGYVTPCNFDNDDAIRFYEDNIWDLFNHFGLEHQGVAPCAGGLAVLYEVRAAIEKDARWYDKAIEYLHFSKASLEEIYGSRSARQLPRYREDSWRIEKIQRKRARRLAAAARPRTALATVPVSHASVQAIRVSVGREFVEQIEFAFSDGTAQTFGQPGPFVWKEPEEDDALQPVDPFFGTPGPQAKGKSESELTFTLKDGEFLVGIITHEGQSCASGAGDEPREMVNACQFATTLGRRSRWYARTKQPRGPERMYWAKRLCHIIGLSPVLGTGGVAAPLVLEQARRPETLDITATSTAPTA